MIKYILWSKLFKLLNDFCWLKKTFTTITFYLNKKTFVVDIITFTNFNLDIYCFENDKIYFFKADKIFIVILLEYKISVYVFLLYIINLFLKYIKIQSYVINLIDNF